MTQKLPAETDWLKWPETQKLIAAFGDQPIRFVGGCVRDALLNRKVSDVDAATPLPPEQVIELLCKASIKAIPTGIDHGTVTAVIDGKPFEVTTLRRDEATDGRHATVAYTDSWQEDAARRDFTMNALYADPQGNVTDFFGGIDDAKAGRVKFIGDAEQRIREDGLRILRYFRFYAHYGDGKMDKAAIDACTKLAPMIDQLSGERIQQEMLKLLVAKNAGVVTEMMQQCNLLLPIIGCKTHTEVLTLLTALTHMAQEKPDAILSLAALLRAGDGDPAFIQNRWKLSNAHAKQLQVLCATKLQLTQFEALTKRQIRVLGKQDFIQLMLLYAAEGAEHEPVIAAIKLAREWEIPAFPVSGDDLKAQGVAQGKAMGEMLKTLEAVWEKSGYVASKQDLLKSIP